MPSNSLLLVFGVVFAIGAIVFGIGTSLLRTRGADESPIPAWTLDVAGGEELTPDERIELIERLALVAQPWSVALIERAAREDRDARVRRVAKQRQPGKINA